MPEMPGKDGKMRVVILIYLLINSWTDIRRREVNLWYTGIFTGYIILCQWYQHRLWDVWGMIPGILLWGASLAAKGQIGEGDGIVTMVTGWSVGLHNIWNMTVSSFFLAAAGAVVYKMMGKKEIPYLPFFTASYLIFLKEVTTV